jgi:hypothetical protein
MSDGPLLRGWTGEYLQVRILAGGECRVWHADGSYLGLLVPDAAALAGLAGAVFGPDGRYLADASAGRLTVDMPRRRAGAPPAANLTVYASPGDIEPTDRRWPRREQPPVTSA